MGVLLQCDLRNNFGAGLRYLRRMLRRFISYAIYSLSTKVAWFMTWTTLQWRRRDTITQCWRKITMAGVVVVSEQQRCRSSS